MATQGNILQAGYTDLSTLVDNQSEILSPFDILPNSAPSQLSNYQAFSSTLDWYYEGSWLGYVVNPKMIFSSNPFGPHSRPQLSNPIHAFTTSDNSIKRFSIIKIDNVWHIRALFKDSPVSGDWAQFLWRLKGGQSTFNTSTWDAVGRDEILITDADSPISIQVIEADSNTPTAWTDNWVVNSDGTELLFASDNTQGNTGLAPMTTSSLNYPSAPEVEVSIGQIYKGTTESYSAISSPFEYIPFGDSLRLDFDQDPSNTHVQETHSTWLPGPILAQDGVFISSSEWLDNSTYSLDFYEPGGRPDDYRAFAGPSKIEPSNGDGLITRTTLGAVALQGQDDSNHWGQTFSQGLSAVQNGQFTFMVGSNRDVTPGNTINGISNTLVTKRFKLVAGQTDMSASANVTLAAYDPALHPADWDSQWVLSTDGNQLTYYAGSNSSTNFEDLNSNINNVSATPSEPTANNDPVTITDGGSGYPSTGTNVAVENGSGKGMTVDYETTAGAVTSVTISDPGVDYEVGDQVQITGGATPATITLNQASPDSNVGETINGRTIIARNETGQFGTNSMMDSVVSIESENSVNVDPIVYQQKVNYVHEQMFSTSSYSFPCYDNISEYEVINLGSDALNYSDNTDSISLTGFYGS